MSTSSQSSIPDRGPGRFPPGVCDIKKLRRQIKYPMDATFSVARVPGGGGIAFITYGAEGKPHEEEHWEVIARAGHPESEVRARIDDYMDALGWKQWLPEEGGYLREIAVEEIADYFDAAPPAPVPVHLPDPDGPTTDLATELFDAGA